MDKFVYFSEEEFLDLLHEANLTRKDFIKLAGCYEVNLYRWIREKRFPYYVKLLLEIAIKIKRIKENENSKSNIPLDLELEKLIKENETLEQEIKSYEKIEELFQKTFGFKMGEKH